LKVHRQFQVSGTACNLNCNCSYDLDKKAQEERSFLEEEKNLGKETEVENGTQYAEVL
jgi:hypothetical protein